jgi:hypothetical protein
MLNLNLEMFFTGGKVTGLLRVPVRNDVTRQYLTRIFSEGRRRTRKFSGISTVTGNTIPILSECDP